MRYFTRVPLFLLTKMFRLVNSPIVEAVDIVEKLSGRDDKALKLALFSLQKYIQVSDDVLYLAHVLTLFL